MSPHSAFDEYITNPASPGLAGGNQSRLAVPGTAAQNLTNKLSSTLATVANNSASNVERIIKSITRFPEFQFHYLDNDCWRKKINLLYKTILFERAETAPSIDWWGPFGRTKTELVQKASNIITTDIYVFAAEEVYRKKFGEAQESLAGCLGSTDAQNRSDLLKQDNVPAVDPERIIILPFDRRMDKLALDSIDGADIRIPFNTAHQRVSTSGHIISEKALAEQHSDVNKAELVANLDAIKASMRYDDLYLGVDAMINPYAIIKLYGSKGGEYLLDQIGKRRWYEVDETNGNADFTSYSKNPTTTSIIHWGNGDPFGRTPYHFTDFAFCKHWNIIENNRMITLRRFAAPILDNLKFPGIEGAVAQGLPAKDDDQNEKIPASPPSGVREDDGGDSKPSAFPPMATAITYFGEDTGNDLSDLLKFSTGLEWEEVTADLHTPRPASTPDMDAGAGGLSSGLTKYAKMFNIATGNFNQSAIMNQGAPPPDPYIDGPYENRILGPVNRIQSVQKRKPGLKYDHPLTLTFNYVARPIGGINLKAALLEVLSNFLIIGSASAVFWGGQHRFMGDPIKYPFIGGAKGMQQWYKGNPVGWGKETVGQFATGIASIGDGIGEFFKSLLSAGSGGDIFGGIKNLFSDKSIGANILRAKIAEKSSGQIPYLIGMKALLIGEPVGEWHVTIGNPFNPIAMIGNLICTKIDVEFGNELGPDDFPIDMKITVHLDHGMARDKDAIQSIFNRGMGRIYDLPDDFKGTADYETAVDKHTQVPNRSETGNQPIYYKVPIGSEGTQVGKFGKSAVLPNALGGNVSVWNRSDLSKQLSPNQDIDLSRDKIEFNRSAFRDGGWIGFKAAK